MAKQVFQTTFAGRELIVETGQVAKQANGSRSNLEILDELKAKNFQTEVGPGVYDIHSPRVPNEGEIDNTIEAILAKVPSKKVWINPDCGLKTRGIPETKESLIRLVEAAKAAREKL
ncbi:5-methyltetrahydropteroyltriglutamate/homocysteine S-methyltransferase [Streptococcus pneumoniae]|nr:5-methyltetrahydropteroyltriglutamate/homocysteine S-methyltransferase [Streptococcus pneumoniae]